MHGLGMVWSWFGHRLGIGIGIGHRLGMGSTCNHIAAAFFRVEVAMRLGLINPACTEKICEWLPNRKTINPVKIKDIDLNRQDFRTRGKTVKRLLTTPKKNYDPLVQPQKQPLDLHDFANKLKGITNKTKSELANIYDT